jgi:ribosomal subunit interface protein
MQLPLRITFRHMDPSPAVEEVVREHATRLERFFDHITRCDVIIDLPHQHHRKGNLFSVHVDITVPGSEIVVKRDPDEHHANEDAYAAINEAFDVARRQVEEYVRKRRGHVKVHEETPQGHVFYLDPDGEFGKLRTADDREIYFHRNSVVDASYEELCLGTEVRFVEEQGEKGPQASTLHVVGKRQSNH